MGKTVCAAKLKTADECCLKSDIDDMAGCAAGLIERM